VIIGTLAVETGTETETIETTETSPKDRVQEIGDKLGNYLAMVIKFIFGEDDFNKIKENDAWGFVDNSDFVVALFAFILPALFVYFIVHDMFLVMALFRDSTCKALAVIIALFCGKLGIYYKILTLVDNIFNNLFISTLSIVFTFILLWWAFGHVILGYRISKEINNQVYATKYLSRIGKALETEAREGR
jgi:hypothetical protein